MSSKETRWVACVRCMRHGHFVFPGDPGPYDEVYSKLGAYELLSGYVVEGLMSAENAGRLECEVDASSLPAEVPEDVASQCIAPIVNADQWVGDVTGSSGQEVQLTCDRARLAVCRYYIAQIPELRLQ